MTTEELKQRTNWLELIVDTNLCERSQIEPLLTEASELVAIMAASRKLALGNRKSAMR